MIYFEKENGVLNSDEETIFLKIHEIEKERASGVADLAPIIAAKFGDVVASADIIRINKKKRKDRLQAKQQREEARKARKVRKAKRAKKPK